MMEPIPTLHDLGRRGSRLRLNCTTCGWAITLRPEELLRLQDQEAGHWRCGHCGRDSVNGSIIAADYKPPPEVPAWRWPEKPAPMGKTQSMVELALRISASRAIKEAEGKTIPAPERARRAFIRLAHAAEGPMGFTQIDGTRVGF
ncbi:MAG: hypothetical protein IT548_02495 [Alphaproteobacteria bacterium]|nr:hypothetical protein [Alphaproteobacteria bacterium]